MFDDEAERNRFRDALASLEGATRLREAGSTAARLKQATHRWRHGLLSNFDYLLELNELADRTRNDLTQYPIFPWVLADYTSDTLDLDDPAVYRDLSKPVGALNQTRLQSFRERLMAITADDERFMYGTHYSTPGYVLYYLVRSRPDLMLRLQNGRFDAPDRLFDSIADTWQGVLASPTDVKELIPEFYDTESAEAGQFLCNDRHLDLGQRSDGRTLGDVRLPPWAADAKDFVTTMRRALESPHVTAHLPQWIDLIFGSKQRGLAAELADNLFHPVTYDGGAQLEREVDPVRRRALQAQIREFGQTPAQLFFEPHPGRLSGAAGASGAADGSGEAKPTQGPDDVWWDQLANVATPATVLTRKAHRGAILDLCSLGEGTLADDLGGSDIATVGEDGMLKVFRVSEDGGSVAQRRAVSLSDMALSGVAEVRENTLLASSWSNGLFVYSIDFGRVVDAMESAHDDAIAGLATSRAVRSAATVSWDCSVRLWQWREDGTLDRVPVWDSLEALDDEGRCVTLGGPGGDSFIVAGARDGRVAMCDVRAGPAPVRDFHPFVSAPSGIAVASLCLAEDGRHLVATGADDGSDAGVVALLDLGMGSVVAAHPTDAQVWTSACHAGPTGAVAATGDGRGHLSLWSTSSPTAALRTQDCALSRGIRSLRRGRGGLIMGGVDGDMAWCKV